MIRDFTDLSEQAIYQHRVRQAIRAAQHNVKQVGVLLIAFDTADSPLFQLGKLAMEFSDGMLIRLKSTLRDSDTVVRMENGLMAVVLASVTSSDDVNLVTQKILNRLQQPLNIQGFNISVKLRIGSAISPQHSANANILMQQAHLALLAAKRQKHQFVIFSEDHSVVDYVPLRMSELRQAIVADQLFLLYQPKVNLKTGAVSGVEVLTRWQHPKFGIIPPDEFIPLAERTGLITLLTLWVLHRSLLQCRTWKETGLDLSIAVNLSVWSLEAQELPEQIEGLLKGVGISAENLELEITESAIMDDPQQAMRTLTLIRELGVKFAIDDFGTGYSSLAYLKKLPVSCIKIDKSFVLNMEADRDNATIVRSIVDLGHNLGLKVVAEGVETCRTKEMLQAIECDEAQGYYFSRPIPAYALGKLLTEAAAEPVAHTESQVESLGALLQKSFEPGGREQ